MGGFWSDKKDLKNEELEFETLFKKEKSLTKEFNKDFNFVLKKSDLKINLNSKIDNNDGYVLFRGNLVKIQKYTFSKIKNFDTFEPNLIFKNKNLIFFDNKGSILSFNENSKFNWKVNNYSKAEKKLRDYILKRKKNKLRLLDYLHLKTEAYIRFDLLFTQ